MKKQELKRYSEGFKARMVGRMTGPGALGLQALALKDPEDGEALVEAFRELDRAGFPRVRRALRHEWGTLVAERTLRGHLRSGDDALGNWVRVLVGAAVKGPSGAPAVRRAVQQALCQTAKSLNRPRGGGAWHDPYGFKERGELFTLARLSQDLDGRSLIQQHMPTLQRLLGEILAERPSRLDRVRQRWFAELGGAELMDDVLAFWRKHLEEIVPDPNRADYGSCVKWLLAARELDRPSGDRLLARWGTTHHLKRKLWKAVREAGLPVPPGVKSD